MWPDLGDEMPIDRWEFLNEKSGQVKGSQNIFPAEFRPGWSRMDPEGEALHD
jgi:hypothetical protein